MITAVREMTADAAGLHWMCDALFNVDDGTTPSNFLASAEAFDTEFRLRWGGNLFPR
jgi:hypothetical protein